MANQIKISPIVDKPIPKDFRTMESSLISKGYVSTGTQRFLMPKVEADGRYRTGLDVTAQYLLKMAPEEKEAELTFIKETLSKLKEAYPDTDFGPRSKVWNAFSNAPLKVRHISLGNTPLILNPDGDLFDLLTYCWVRVHPDIARSMESFSRGECPDCQYYLANDEAENRVLFSRKKRINNAIVEFEKLSPTKKKQIACLMGLPVSDSSTEEAVYNLMDSTLKETEFTSGEFKTLSPIAVFEDLLKITDDRLRVKDLVELAIRHNIYRKGAGGKIQEGTETVASSKDELVNFLMDDKNQNDLLALEARIKQKKAVVA